MTKTSKQTTKTATKTEPAKKAPPVRSAEKGYAGHNAGSRKEQVHKCFDEKGLDAALALGERLGLKATTLRSWTAFWKRTKPAPKAKGSKAPKATEAKAA